MTATEPLRIAMWSGPRNISTAMMRSFENRPDCAVLDEPFYAAYLAETGIDHPLREETLASQPADWRHVVQTLLGPAPRGRPIFYQKHMAHHMLAGIDVGWMAHCRNVFLIRAPEQVLSSYQARRETVTLADIGTLRQAELFDAECNRLGAPPPVVDADDILADPRTSLTALCDTLGIAFTTNMLHWPPGPRPTDGAWAPAWYADVLRSTGLAARKRPPAAKLDAHLRAIAETARPHYDRLKSYTNSN